MPATEEIAQQLVDLLQRLIRFRPRWTVPEQELKFKKQYASLKKAAATDLEDRTSLPRIFIILAQNEVPPTMGELSTELGMPLSSTTRIVDWLVNAKLVERYPDSNDRRIVRVRMTAKAKELFGAIGSHLKQQVMRLLEDFSMTEQKELLRLVTKLLDALLAQK
ncbi:MAG TPA: MarR family transcriptional regulator [Anaerolineales bacterium]|nr:MarR family transcriptional regulator [Anaerolineales bacterium]